MAWAPNIHLEIINEGYSSGDSKAFTITLMGFESDPSLSSPEYVYVILVDTVVVTSGIDPRINSALLFGCFCAPPPSPNVI